MAETVARQQARAVGTITECFLLGNPSESDLHKINTMPEKTLQRKIKTIYSVADGIPGIVKNNPGQVPELLLEFHEGWVEFYLKHGIKIDLNDYKLDPSRFTFADGQNYWSIITPPAMTPQKAYEIRKSVSKTYEGITPSKITDIFPRVPVSVIRANKIARVEHPNVSCLKSIELGLWGTTFTEGCLIDGRVWTDLQIHLDEDGWTMHSGSRSEGGEVVGSHWNPGYEKWCVDLNSLSCEHSHLSLRQKQF